MRLVQGFALCCVMVLVGSPVEALADGSSPVEGAGASPPFGNLLVVPGSPLEGEELLAEREAELGSPEAVAEREASRTKFEGLSTQQAANVASEAFPGVMDEPAGGPPKLPVGQSISGYAAENAAQVALPGGRHGVLESMAPIAVETSPGHLTPLDLSLGAAEGGFLEPKTPVVLVRIPEQVGAGVQLPGVGVSLTPVDAQGAALSGSEGVSDGASVLFANTQTDADTVVKPVTAGFEADTVLRSVDSPHELSFRVGMPDGASFMLANDGSGNGLVVKDGVVIARMLVPSARDTAGTMVPVSMSASGGVVSVSVESAAGSFQYPIMVDPTVTDGLVTGEDSNWRVDTNNSAAFTFHEPPGSFEDDDFGVEYKREQWGGEAYETQGESHIYGFTSETSATNAGANIENALFITSAGGGIERIQVMSPTYAKTKKELCVQVGCATGTVTSTDKGNAAEFMQTATNTGHEFSSALTSTSVEILQEKGPAASINTTSPTISGKQNIFYPGKWIGAFGTSEVALSDPGLGVSALRMKAPGWSQEVTFGGSCKGVQCPQSDTYPAKAGEGGFTAAGLASGENTVEFTAVDPVGLTSTASGKIKLDTTRPRNMVLSGLPAGKEFGGGSDTLKVTAEEGTASTPSAGIESIKLSIDGKEVGKPNGSCAVPSGSCAATAEWTINGSEYSGEQHTIKMTATSNAGESAEGIVLTQPTPSRALPLAVGPGSVNPKTGELLLNATDVSVAASGGGLSVTRSFDSFHPSGGAEGPLGPQWSISVGAAQSLMRAAEGAVVMTAVEGQQSVFTSKGKGEFNSPVNAASLTLTEVLEGEKTKEFVLKGADGSATRFTAPSGGSGNLWTPSSVEGPGGTNVTTYAFQTVGAITEPTKVLAPPPAGVSCTAELVRGCRALGFVYSTTTTAGGENPSEWGEYVGRLKEVTLTAWEPSSGKMQTTTVAKYAFDSTGKLRGEWNSLVSPALETTYGYDQSSHVTAITAPGQQPWALTYGRLASPGTEQLLKVTQAQPKVGATEAEINARLNEQKERPKNTVAPKLSGTAVVGLRLAVSTGTWTKSPIAYRYQWRDCNSKAEACSEILGANNANYTLASSDVGHTVVAVVTAINGGGSLQASSAGSAVAKASWPPESTEYVLPAKTEPESIAVGPDGNLWFSDFGSNKIGKITPSGTISEYSISGAGSEELEGITAGPDGNVWFVAEGVSKVGKITSTGEKTLYSLPPASYPRDIVAGPEKEAALWFTEEGSGKIGRITPSGVVTEYTVGASTAPTAIAAGPDGNLWFTEENAGKNKIGKITPAGKVTQFTVAEAASPLNITAGPEKENALWFTERGSSKIGKITTAGTITEFALSGGATATSITASPDGSLWFTEEGSNKVGKITTAGVITEFSLPEGTKPRGISPGPEKEKVLWLTDKGSSKIGKLNVTPPPEGEQQPAGPGETIEYNVPVSGKGAPYSMGSSEVEAWGEIDHPGEATAIFAADEPMGWPATDYKRATIAYLDKNERTVNIAHPGGAISTSEYNAQGDVARTLSPDNRATALKEGAKSGEVSKLLDTENAYNASGNEMQSTVGPEHNIKLSSGTQVHARHRTVFSYDEGAPTEGGPYGLPTKTTEGAQYAGKEEDVRETRMSYSGQENLGWKLHKPTSVTTDPKGLKLTHTTILEPSTGAIKEAIMPAGSTSEKTAHGSEAIYYTAAKNALVPACGEHPEWANLPCQTQPAKQPETSGLPNLPVTNVTYNMWQEAEKTTETVGSTTRTTTMTFDAAGRPKTSTVSSTVGAALPTETNEFNERTGALEKQSTTTEGKAKTITSIENTLGELVSYTDADGNASTYTWDIDHRLEKLNDGKGTQSNTYDTTTGELTKLVDSAAGTFTGSFDPEGKLLVEGYPNGMNASYAYDATGSPVSLEYVKTTHCTEQCVLFSDTVVPSIHGQWLEQASTLSHQAYADDAAGRLTQVQNTPAGKGCTTRIYANDPDTNRTSLTTREPNVKGECASEGGTIEKHSYDAADRLTDAGVAYSTFGNITALPATDAGGSELASSYYVDNQIASQTQNGETIGYNLDPAGRTRETVATGKTSQDIISHYDEGASTPAWTLETPSGHWTRNIPGIDGGLAAVQNNGEMPVLQLADLHGDTIGTASRSETETKLLSSTDTSEFGVPTTSTPPEYSWLGADELSTELPSGVIAMGARTYVPQLGRFLQTDPAPGGSANAYTYTFGDPVNSSDPSGALTYGFSSWLKEANNQEAQEVAAREAARETLEREEAERRAQAAAAAAAAAGPQYSEPPFVEQYAMGGPSLTETLAAEGVTPGGGMEEGRLDGSATDSLLGEDNGIEHRCPVGQLYLKKKCVQSKPPVRVPPPPPNHPSGHKERSSCSYFGLFHGPCPIISAQ